MRAIQGPSLQRAAASNNVHVRITMRSTYVYTYVCRSVYVYADVRTYVLLLVQFDVDVQSDPGVCTRM